MGTLFMPDWNSQLPHYSLLIFGGISFSGAVVSTFTGKTWGRVGRSICRAKEPISFWCIVATYYLSAVFFIGIFMYGRINGLSH
jgi:hypothetical protein